MFRIVIFGSRHYKDYDQFEAACDRLLAKRHPDIEIVEGDCQGPDNMAEIYAAKRGYQHRKFPADWKRLGKKAGFVRNNQMAQYVSENMPNAGGISFWDGVSKGTSMMISLLKDRKIPIKIISVPLMIKGAGRSSSRSQQNDPLSDILTAGRPRKRKISPIVVDGEELIPDIKDKPKPKKSAIPVDPGWKNIYQAAHERWFAKEYPKTYADKHYCEPNYPDPKTTNGITSIIIDHLKWEGHYSNRQNVMGRQIGGITKTRSGATFDDRKYIKSSTRKGASDISAAIYGRMIAIEVKNEHTKDTMKENQEKEQKRVEAAGGVYVVIQSVGQYFAWYEKYMADHPQQPSLFL